VCTEIWLLSLMKVRCNFGWYLFQEILLCFTSVITRAVNFVIGFKLLYLRCVNGKPIQSSRRLAAIFIDIWPFKVRYWFLLLFCVFTEAWKENLYGASLRGRHLTKNVMILLEHLYQRPLITRRVTSRFNMGAILNSRSAGTLAVGG